MLAQRREAPILPLIQGHCTRASSHRFNIREWSVISCLKLRMMSDVDPILFFVSLNEELIRKGCVPDCVYRTRGSERQQSLSGRSLIVIWCRIESISIIMMFLWIVCVAQLSPHIEFPQPSHIVILSLSPLLRILNDV